MHFHVGVLGDQHPECGILSEEYMERIEYKAFLFFLGLKEDEDKVLSAPFVCYSIKP